MGLGLRLRLEERAYPYNGYPYLKLPNHTILIVGSDYKP